MTSICCVLTGSKYSVYDVNKLYVSLKKYTTKPFKFYCYTDHDKTRFNKQINLISITKQDRKLQWHKTIFFKKDIVEEEDIILMDIDQVIIETVIFYLIVLKMMSLEAHIGFGGVGEKIEIIKSLH